jgi:hypothetical protein
MGCVIANSTKWIKSKIFEISAVEEAVEARGISKAKIYQKFPKLLESKRYQKPVDVLTQFEISEYLHFPIDFFFHRNVPDQKRIIFMCGKGLVSCAFCGHLAEYYCDYPIGDGRTCDLPLCKEHKKHRPDIGVDIDYCPHHKGKSF